MHFEEMASRTLRRQISVVEYLHLREVPGSPVVRTSHFHCGGHGSVWPGTGWGGGGG